MLRTLKMLALSLLMTGGLLGCSAAPEPLTIVMPTYSYHRDGIDTTANAQPVKFDSVAAVEP